MSRPCAVNRDRSPPGEAPDRSPSSIEQVRTMLPPGGGLWRALGPIGSNRGQAAVPPAATAVSFHGPPSAAFVAASPAKDATIQAEPSFQPTIEAPRGRTVNRDGQAHELHRLSPEERAQFRRHVSLVVFLSTGAILVIALYLLLRLG